ncbi:HEAT repeat protein [Cooperia oncophora]
MILINRAGDVSNAFIREDAGEALTKVVNYASAGKALQAIIAAGSKSKNNTIRATCAGFVCSLVSRLGTTTILSSPDQLSKLISQLLAFSRDPNAQVRMHGKQTLLNLSQDANFDRQVKKAVSDSDYRAIRCILDEIDKKVGNNPISWTQSHIWSGRGMIFYRDDPWERRLGGLKRFEEMCSSATKAVASEHQGTSPLAQREVAENNQHLLQLTEAFIGRLNDINSKVSLEGLDTYMVTLPVLSKLYSTEAHLKAVLNQLVLALMSHLSSKSDEHRKTAQKCLTETIKRVGQSFSLSLAYSDLIRALLRNS